MLHACLMGRLVQGIGEITYGPPQPPAIKIRIRGTSMSFVAIPAKFPLTLLRKSVLIALASVVVACGGGGDDNPPAANGSPGNTDVAEINAFGSTLYPVLVTNCATCHGDSGPNTQFAQSNTTASYDIVIDRQLVSLGNPSGSELVRRLVVDQHNCWSDCVANGNEIAAAIGQWQALSTATGNSLPIAQNDQYATTTDTKLSITTVLANDSDPDGDTLTVLSVDAASISGGVVENKGNNTFDYTPAAAFTGNDTFTYTVSDGNGGTAQATVTVVVSAEGAVAVDSVAAFEQTVFPLVRTHCAACHSGGLQQDLPLFASADVTVAHDVVVNNKLVNFGNTSNSTLVERLANDKHFCWTKDCESDAEEMKTKIDEWSVLVGR